MNSNWAGISANINIEYVIEIAGVENGGITLIARGTVGSSPALHEKPQDNVPVHYKEAASVFYKSSEYAVSFILVN